MEFLSSVFKVFLDVFQDLVIRYFRPVLLEYGIREELGENNELPNLEKHEEKF